VTAPAYRGALDLIAEARFPLDRLRTHVFPLAEAERAIQVLAGEVPGEHPVNVVIQPTDRIG
jgi:threonine dehydrogenase-like Zn-dependent dehydrogenase